MIITPRKSEHGYNRIVAVAETKEEEELLVEVEAALRKHTAGRDDDKYESREIQKD